MPQITPQFSFERLHMPEILAEYKMFMLPKTSQWIFEIMGLQNIVLRMWGCHKLSPWLSIETAWPYVGIAIEMEYYHRRCCWQLLVAAVGQPSSAFSAGARSSLSVVEAAAGTTACWYWPWLLKFESLKGTMDSVIYLTNFLYLFCNWVEGLES